MGRGSSLLYDQSYRSFRMMQVNMRECVSSHFQAPRRELKIQRSAEYLFFTFRVFDVETKTREKTEK